MPVRNPASANVRLNGSPTWPAPPRTTTSRSDDMPETVAARCAATPRADGPGLVGTAPFRIDETLSKALRFDMLRRRAVAIVLQTTLGRDRAPGCGMTSLLRNPRVISALIAAWFIPTIVFWLRLSSHLLLNDGLVYRAGAEALLAGGDPWAATVNGYSYAAPPLELVPFIPGALVPVPVFMVAWGAICAASVLIIGRRLGWVWLLYPPLLHGAWLGNPAIPGMVAVMLGLPLLGLVLKPQLLFVGPRRAVAIFAVLSLLALVLRPDFLAAFSSLVGGYGDQSAVVNAWMTPWMIPVGISLI